MKKKQIIHSTKINKENINENNKIINENYKLDSIFFKLYDDRNIQK